GGPGGDDGGGGVHARPPRPPQPPPKKYNALGILEDVPQTSAEGNGAEAAEAIDIGPAELPSTEPVAARKDPTIVGAGKLRSLEPKAATVGRAGAPGAAADKDAWANVGRNDPCPCGSGKKFKKCHGK
ncbi:MAG TPA: SEC-C metal-binding domain-containing protein, partial [Candidatus Limnocylindria bacterium]|nr:SEC-C metal-binding domain-containing protein [Candidatus Limnocylindria bacterium]